MGVISVPVQASSWIKFNPRQQGAPNSAAVPQGHPLLRDSALSWANTSIEQ